MILPIHEDRWIEQRDVDRQLQRAREHDPSLASVRAAEAILVQLAKKTGDGASLVECEQLKQELGYDTANPLERLAMDVILAARVRWLHEEKITTQYDTGESLPTRQVAFQHQMLTSAQSRFLRAVESLARIRRLTRNMPKVQINFAGPGAKQLNVQQ